MDSDKIHPPITNVLLRDAAGNLARSKKQWYWTLRNAVLLPQLLTDATILDRGSGTGEILKIFSRSVKERA